MDYWTEKAEQEYVPPLSFAIIYAQLGEKNQAFEWLEKAYEERQGLIFLKVESIYDPLRDHLRFQELLRRMNLEPCGASEIVPSPPKTMIRRSLHLIC